MSDEIIGFVVERIVDLVAEEVNLLRGAKNKFVSLQRELEIMQSFVIDADSKVEGGDERLRTIVKQIKEMAYEAEDLIDSFVQKDIDREEKAFVQTDIDREEKAKVSFLKRIISYCSCLVQTHQMGDEVEELKSRIRETTERLQTYQVRTNVKVIRRERPQSYPHSIGDDNVVGFDNDMEVLVGKFINLDDKILVIVGMGGSGKTTMARKIYNHTKICHHFKCRAWVSVSQIWNQESLLKAILRQTTGQTGETLPVEAIIEEIHKSLQGKSYLVVLDDVWEQDVLRKVMVPIATLHGCKVLITTRIREVVQFPGLGYYVHESRRLTAEESWELFQKIAFIRQNIPIMGHESKPYEVLGHEMLKKCDGLPLAIISLAGLLSTKSTIHEWERVKSNVSSKIIGERTGPCDYGRVEDMLALSYSDLNHTLKSCFMYLGLFPEDEDIRTRVLMQCWIAEGFFKSVQLQANESMEEVAKQHLDELIGRCLVQVVKVNIAEAAKVIKVHDLMRDLAIKRAKEMCFLETIPSSSLTSSPRRLAVVTTKNLNDILEGDQIYKGSRRLRSFVCWSNDWLSERSFKNLFTNYPFLRVLILNLPGDSCIIPDEIGNLIHLRHFQISNAKMRINLPNSINNLRNLLSFETSEPVHGLSLNLKRMKELSYLRIPWFFIVKGQEPPNLHHLRNLKVLNMRAGEWIMTELKLLSPTVEKLAIHNIENSEQLDMIYECPSIVQDSLYSLMLNFDNGEFEVQNLQHCLYLQKLKVHGVVAAAESVPLAFPPYLLKLVLHKSRIEDHDLFVAALVKLPYLKFLDLWSQSYLGSHLNFPENSMLHLQELSLSHLYSLEEIHVKECSMPQLKAVHIEHCPQLKSLPQRLKRPQLLSHAMEY